MKRTKQLFKSTIVLTGTKFITQAINFFLLPLYTNLLTTSEYGTIDVLFTIILVGVPIFTLQIEMGVFRYYIIENDNNVVTTGFIVILVNMILLSIPVFLLGTRWFETLYALFICVMIAAEGVNALMLQLCRAKGDNLGYGLCSTIISIIKSGLCVISVGLMGLRIRGYLLGALIAQIIGIIILFFRSKVWLDFNWKNFDKQYASRIIKYSVPLVFNQMASWIVNFSDRIIIAAYLGLGDNGIYSAASKLSNMILGVMAMFNLAWTENVTRNLNNKGNQDYIAEALMNFIRVILLCVAVLIGILPCFFNILIGVDFYESYNHVPILLLAMAFSGIAAFLGSVYTAYGKTTQIAVTTIFAAVINLIIDLLFITKIGLYAASLSTLISFFALALIRYCFMRKFIQIRIANSGIMPIVVITLFIGIFYYLKFTVGSVIFALILIYYAMKMAYPFLRKNTRH